MVFLKKEKSEQGQVMKTVIVYFHSALIWLIENNTAHTSMLWRGRGVRVCSYEYAFLTEAFDNNYAKWVHYRV